jgi:hypothetical protein
MGGLVIRSALAQSEQATGWLGLVRDTVTLGTPHLGAPLEQATAALTRALSRLGETRAIATVLAARSAGIKDLRHGNLLEADWAGHHPDALGNRRTHVPLHEGARHFVVLSTLSGPVAHVLGDLLVHPKSALGDTGDDLRLSFPAENVAQLAGLHHFDLLNHPSVYQQMHQWLTSRPANEPASEAGG